MSTRAFLYTAEYRTPELDFPYAWRLPEFQGPLGRMRLQGTHPQCRCPHRKEEAEFPLFSLHDRDGIFEPYRLPSSPATCDSCPMKRNTDQPFADCWSRGPVLLHRRDFIACPEPGSAQALASSQRVAPWIFKHVSKAMTLCSFHQETKGTGVSAGLFFPTLQRLINLDCVDGVPIAGLARTEGIIYGAGIAEEISVPGNCSDEDIVSVDLSIYNPGNSSHWNKFQVPFFAADLKLSRRYASIYGHPISGPYLVFYILDAKRKSNRLFSLPIFFLDDRLLVVESAVEREFGFWLHKYRGNPWTYKPMSLANFADIPHENERMGYLVESGWKPAYRFDFLIGFQLRPMVVEVAGFSDPDYNASMDKKTAYWRQFNGKLGFATVRRNKGSYSSKDAFEVEVRS